MHRSLLAALTMLLGCGSDTDTGSDLDAGADATDDDRFAAVTAELEVSFPDRPAGVEGMTLVVYDSADRQIYRHTVGDHDTADRQAVASASKLVSALVLMRLVDRGELALDSTTGGVLGWGAANGAITLDQLGGFVSGLRANPLCSYLPTTTLADCVDTISGLAVEAAPGAQLEYGNSHLHVAARMAEVVTGESWNAIAGAELFEPLGIATADLAYFTSPKQANGTTNPLVAGGLRATTDEYAEILALLFHRGARGGEALISEALMQRFTENHFTSAAVVATPYADSGIDFRYGFGSWLECTGAPPSCDRVSSAGAFGFTPWVDYTAGYYAILSMESDEVGGGSAFSVPVQQRLLPLIADAL
jgi:CubicO group peptidase (beta-lactamase class C family)